MGFASGFAAGSQAVSRGVSMAYEGEAAQRAQEKHAADMAAIERQRRLDAEADNAFADMNGLMTNGRVTGNRSGFSDGSAAMLNSQGGQAAVDEAASYANVENRRFGLPTTNTTSVGAAPTIDTRAATPLEMNQAAQRVALAQRNLRDWATLGDKGRQLQEDEVFAAAMKKGYDPEMAKWVNQKHSSVTVGAPDKNGISRLSVVRPDGEAVFAKLNAADQAKLSGAIAIMSLNPTRALQIIDGVNKDLAAVVAADNNLTVGVADKNNDGAYKGQKLNNERIELGIKEKTAAATLAHYKALENRYSAEDWSLVGASDDGKGLVRYNKRTGQLITQPLPEGTDAKGLFRKLTGDKPVGPGTAREVPAEGTLMQDNRGIWKADGRGGIMDKDGVEPSKRKGVLTKAGLLPTDAETLEWTPDGRYVAWGGLAFDPTDPKDVTELRSRLKQYGVDSVRASEVDQSQGRFAPRWAPPPPPPVDDWTGRRAPNYSVTRSSS